MEGVLLFVILAHLIFQHQVHRRPGMVVAWFLTFYGLFRFIAEFFRDSESKLYGWFSMGQALSLPMWAAAAFFFWYALAHPRQRETVNPLKEKILRLIRETGPITLAHYMQMALLDPEHGYYMKRDPLGRDFITAPEISQMFGELIGLLLRPGLGGSRPAGKISSGGARTRARHADGGHAARGREGPARFRRRR